MGERMCFRSPVILLVTLTPTCHFRSKNHTICLRISNYRKRTIICHTPEYLHKLLFYTSYFISNLVSEISSYLQFYRTFKTEKGRLDTFALRLPFVSMSRHKIVNPRHFYSKGPLAPRKFTFSPFRHRPTKSGAEMVFAVHRMPILVF